MTVGTYAVVSFMEESSNHSYISPGMEAQESRVIANSSNTQSSILQAKDALGRKRRLSGAFTDPDFARFLVETFGSFDSVDVDASLVGLLGKPGSTVSHESLMNDLPGALDQDNTEHHELSEQTHPSNLPQRSNQAAEVLSAAPSQQQLQPLHRAVITSMPVPSATQAVGAVTAGATGAADDDSDTSSAATLPMPSKRRRRDDDEVTSSPNDLVEMPTSTVVTTASGTAPKTVAPADTAAGGRADHGKQGAMAPTADAAVDGIVKAILVAKVLTKSDSNSKRVILPRIAVEANLPQLAHAQCFNFSATDPNGQSWPLVIKAWANGQNPKPVYVLEQVGELLKQYKITVGDALALMASEDGRFFLEWNTEATRAAAARPTYSAFTFKQQQQPAAGGAPQAPETPKGEQQQQQQQPVSQPVNAQHQQTVSQEQAAATTTQQQQLMPSLPAVEVVQQQPKLQSAFQQQQRLPPPRPVMTAVPVTSAPLVSGAFIPTSPCQLLVMGDSGTTPYLKLDDPMGPSVPASMLVLKTRSDAAEKLPEPENLLLPLPAELGDNGTLHSGGFLLCPRTPGCTRPAGHQGWCLGHKGYKKRGRP